jgi:WD40 repeat protein
MVVEEAIALVNQLLNKVLTPTQEMVFRQSWDGQTYLDMAVNSGYDSNYTKDVGSELWRSLSQALNEKVTKNNLQAVLKRFAQNQQAALQIPTQVSWGEAIDVSQFYGRTAELETLSQWILGDRCRVVTILGMGGMGKTALSVKLAEQIQGEFEYVIWRSLRHAPFAHDKITNLIKILSQQQITTLPASYHEQITFLIEYLRKSRCLLILDNFETLLRQNKRIGCYREGYEPYGELLGRLGETIHQSCILITTRERPDQIIAQEGDGLPVRTLTLSGLEVAASQTILNLKGLSSSDDETRQLVDCYGGNPLALKIASTSIQDLHQGNIAQFLGEGTITFRGISNLLEQQFQRLSLSEQQVMYWLAINRKQVSLTELQATFTPTLSKPELYEVLMSLQWRSLIESIAGGFTQQPVVMEYVSERLIELICQEIATESLQYLLTHALMQAQAKDYIRDIQVNQIVRPLIDRLQVILGSTHQLEHKLGRLIAKLQNEESDEVGYGGGNLLNILAQLETDLTGYDFSGLTIRNCDLRSLKLHHANFSKTIFRDCVFAATFGGITSVAFSSDGLCLASSDTNGEIHIWDISNGQQLFNCKGHNSWVWHLAFSPLYPVLASCGQDHTIKLWNTTTGECLKTLDGHSSIVTAIAFSPNAQLLASSSYDHTVKVWNLATGECVQTLAGHNACVWSVVFHPTGQILATASEDNTVKLWKLETGCMQTLEGHQQWVKAIAFSPNGQILASGSFDQSVKLWDLDTGICLNTLQGHGGVVTSVVFSPKGDRLASGSYDQTVKIWDILDVSSGKCLDTLKKHTNRIWSVAFHPQGHLIASGGDDNATRFWELQTGQCSKTFQGHSNATYAIALFAEQNLLASGHEDETIKLWELNLNPTQGLNDDLQPFRVLNGHSNRVFSIAFSPNGQFLVSSSADRTVKLWNPHTGECLKTLLGHGSWVWAVAFSPDGNLIASGSYDRTVKIWDVSSGECLQTLQGHPGSVLAIAFSLDGKTLFSSGYDKVVKHWDLESGNCLNTWEADSNRVWAVAVSPNCQSIATGGDDFSVKLWEISTATCLRTFSGHTNQVLCILFTEGGDRMISSSSDRTIKIWDVLTGDCLGTLDRHQHWVWSLSLSPDERTLFSGSWDETIKYWDIANSECLQTLRPSRPYEGMMIDGVRGLTEAEISTLKALGAIETNY